MSPHPPPLRIIHGRGPEPGEAAARRDPPIAAALELLALGTGLTFTISLLARLPSWFHHLAAFQSLTALAFAFFALALFRLPRYAGIPHAALAVFAVALATRAALVPVPPSLSGDLYRYLWEGRVVARGGDPYRQSPLDPALAPLRDREVYPQINHKELSAIYPPLAIAGFALVARLAPTVLAFKLWVTLHDLALVALLLLWARRRGQSPVAVIAYAWNPLVLVEYAGTGHNEPTALLWLVASFVLLESRPTLSAIALATAVLVKLAPLVALPLAFARWPWRARAVGLALLAAGLGFYWSETRASYSGLIAYWGTWRNNELLFHVLERVTGSFVTARTLSIALVVAVLAYVLWKRWSPERGARQVLRAGLLAAPVVHPWYLGWELVFEPLRLSWPWLLLSLTAFLNYGVLATPAEGRSFHLSPAGRWVEYGIPLALAITLALWRRGHPRRS